MSLDNATLKQRQSLPLEAKLHMTIKRIREWYDHWDGDVYVAFSGGKDSRVLLDLVWSVYPDVPAVFSNTGLEYPELVKSVKAMQDQYGEERVVFVRPKMTYRQVVQQCGFPVLSKKLSRTLRILKEEKDNPNWANTVRLYDTGIKMDGSYSHTSKIPEKWRKLIHSDYKISELCCDHLKKEPLTTYAKVSGRKPITGMMADEGGKRAAVVKVCNAYDSQYPISSPMLFWKEQDVLEYILSHGIPIPTVYGAIERNADGMLETTGERRTGCMWCMFGVHLERGENRFQRMAKSHPKIYDYCINNLGIGAVLDSIGVNYTPKPEVPQLIQIMPMATGRQEEDVVVERAA